MANKFDWQTESDSWEEPAPAAPRDRALRRRLGFLLVIVIALSAAGAIAYREMSMRLRETTARLEGEVRASHELVQQAIAGKDTELLKSFMSGRDPRWTDAQLALVEAPLPDGYRKFGILRAGGPPAQAAAEVTLSAELDAAEVVAPITFVITPTNGVSTTITLQGASVYRHGEDRWLWSPPDEAFWGNRRSRRLSPSLRLTYPERDTDLVLELAGEITQELDRLCRMLGSDCPEDLALTLAFETDPATLLMTVDDRQRWLSRGDFILLPTPTLIGEPVDREGFATLARVYSAAIAVTLVAGLGDYRCCANEVLAQAALDWQLAALGLRAWPLEPGDYSRLSERFAGLDWGGTFWGLPPQRVDEAGRLFAYALVEYILTERADLTSVDLLRELNATTFNEWLANYLPADADSLPRDFRWQAFLTRQANQALPPLPVPLPDQELAALCQVESQQHALVRYQPVTGRWSSIGASLGRNIEFVVPLDGGQLLIAHSNNAAGSPQLTLYDGDTLLHRGTLSEAPAGFYTIMGLDPSGTRALLLVQPQDSEALQYYMLDAGRCDEGGCNLTRLQGHLSWSPDGENTLVMVAPGGHVWPFIDGQQWPKMIVSLGNEDGAAQQVLSEDALYGLWLDDSTYVLLQSEGGGRAGDSRLVIANHRTGEMLASVPLLDLLESLSLNAPVDDLAQLMVFLVAANQAGNQEVLLMVFDPDAAYADGILYDWRQDEARQLGLENMAWPPGFSPDGRWLIVHEYRAGDDSGGQFHLGLIDLASRTSQSYPGRSFPFGFSLGQDVAWSDDGRWLLYGDGQSLFIISPEHEYRLPLLLDASQCSQAYWLSR